MSKGSGRSSPLASLTLNSVGFGLLPNSEEEMLLAVSTLFGDSSGTFVKTLGDIRPVVGGLIDDEGILEKCFRDLKRK